MFSIHHRRIIKSKQHLHSKAGWLAIHRELLEQVGVDTQPRGQGELQVYLRVNTEVSVQVRAGNTRVYLVVV